MEYIDLVKIILSAVAGSGASWVLYPRLNSKREENNLRKEEFNTVSDIVERSTRQISELSDRINAIEQQKSELMQRISQLSAENEQLMNRMKAVLKANPYKES